MTLKYLTPEERKLMQRALRRSVSIVNPSDRGKLEEFIKHLEWFSKDDLIIQGSFENINWESIKSAPYERLIEVAGDSGYKTDRWFICLARLSDKYKDGRHMWRDVQGDLLSERGWKPLLWRKAILPEGKPEEYKENDK